MDQEALTDTLRETLATFEWGGAPLTTTEVANRLELGRRATYERLDRLVEIDALDTKKVGASGRVWWRSQSDGDDASATEATETTPVADAQFDTFVNEVEEYAIFTMDPDGHVRSWNAGAERIKGYEADEIIGSHFSTFYMQADRADGVPEANLAAAVEDGSIEDEGWRLRSDGSQFWANVTITAVRDEDGILQGFTKVTRDMTDRRAYERQLEERAERVERQRDDLERELETVFERISDGVYGLDEELRVTYANEQARSLLDIDDDATGDSILSVVSSTDQLEWSLETAIQSQESVVVEEYYEEASAWYEYTVYPSESGLSVYVRDVTGRKRRETELRRRVEQQDVIAQLGQRALVERDLDALLDDAARIVAETLGNDYCKVLELADDGDELLLRQGVGWNEGVVGSATVAANEDQSQAAYTLRTEEPVVVENLSEEARFSGPALLTDHDVESGISVIIGPMDDPWGILGVHDTDPQSISENDANFVRAVAAILAAAITRRADERELVHQREQLAALNNLNEVVRDITDAIIDQSTRQEIERTVVDRLADADSFTFAWIGDVDVETQTVSMRVESGVEGYLEDTTISVDPDDEHSHGPTGRAIQSGKLQVTHDVHEDERYGPWRERAETYDFQSSAAIPIVHEGTIYGILNVYADRPNAFAEDVRDVIAQIGEVIGHAIAATERKRALVSDEVVEVELLLPDVFEVTGANESTSGEIRVDYVVPRTEDEFLVHGTTTPDATDSLRALADAASSWGEITIREAAETMRFEARLTEPTILSVITSRGGYVDEAIITGGDVQLTVQLSPHVGVRKFIDAVDEACPAIDLLSRKQRTRHSAESMPFDRHPTRNLTDQQRTSLETAYYAGFFEWPRLVSGEDVAESLDIAPSTFHQHLRKAEKKVLGSVLATTA